MTRFVKREKMSRKARRELDARGRRTWTRSPAVRITESRKNMTGAGQNTICRKWQNRVFSSHLPCAEREGMASCPGDMRRCVLFFPSNPDTVYISEKRTALTGQRCFAIPGTGKGEVFSHEKSDYPGKSRGSLRTETRR